MDWMKSIADAGQRQRVFSLKGERKKEIFFRVATTTNKRRMEEEGVRSCALCIQLSF